MNEKGVLISVFCSLIFARTILSTNFQLVCKLGYIPYNDHKFYTGKNEIVADSTVERLKPESVFSISVT